MTSHQQLFYSKKYSKIIADLGSLQDPSPQESHNLAICRYLTTGESPLPELVRLENQLRSNSPTQSCWPTNPSWPLILYHIALYSFKIGQYSRAISIIDDIWNNSEKQDKLYMLCVSLLNIELSIRSGIQTDVDRSLAYLRANFPTESVQNFVQSKNIEGPFAVYIIEATQYARLRLEAANLISLANKKDKKAMTQYAKLLQGIDLSDNAKSNPKLPLAKGIPLSALAFYFGDLEKSSEILETITDAASYAVYNNRGIFELLKGRYSSALLHFSKALNARHNNELVYPFHRVAYNMGLSLLFKGKPKRAFKYLHSIIPLMKDSPFLWLRLAECIVMYYKQRIAKLRRKTQLSPVVAQKLCTARQTFYVLPATDVKVFETDTKKTPDMTLSFAANCAKNCIALCKPNQTDVKDRAQMVCSFICLELGDGKNANEMGKSVSQGLSFEHQFLAKIYAAQGVMMNGYYEEASKVLSRLLVESSFSQEKEQNTLNNLTLARVFMKIGETKKAESQLSRAAEPDPRRPEVVLTNVWVDIQRKHTTQAIQEIKEYSETSDKPAVDESD